MKIYCLTQKRNWESYSIWRNIYEYLDQRSDISFKWQGREGIPSELIKEIIDYRPQYLFLLNHLSIVDKDLYKMLKKYDIKIITFGLADPNLFNEKRLQFTDLYISNNLMIYNLYRKKHKMYYLPSFCNPKYHKFLNLDKEVKTNFTFVGSGYHPHLKNKRLEMAKILRNNNILLSIWGDHWEKNPHINNYKKIFGEDLIKIINKTSLMVDLTSSYIGLSFRIFESSCCQTPVITLDRPDIRQLFEDGKEILLYKNMDDLIDMCRFYIGHPDILKTIGVNAQERCLKDHTVKIRWDSFFEYLKGE